MHHNKDARKSGEEEVSTLIMLRKIKFGECLLSLRSKCRISPSLLKNLEAKLHKNLEAKLHEIHFNSSFIWV